ncbi:MAG TPA: ABC transporter substrate-binding protein [Kofleriaceae bacterium]|nr:ABC transporter substrate-binding protein [Kofleriaceae bacterium]
MLPRRSIALAAAALAVAAGCFERGKRRPAHDDAASARAGDAGAGAGVGVGAGAALDRGWLAADPSGAPDDAAIVRVALETEPATLDPFASIDAVSARVLGDVTTGLLCTVDGEPRACLSATAGDDSRRWRLALRPGLRFHDGRPVTATDARASLLAAAGKAGKDGHPAGPLAASLDDLRAVTVDGDAVVLDFDHDRCWRSRALDVALVPLVPADELTSPALASAPVGAGPYRIAGWRRGEAIELARADGATPRAPAAGIRFRVTADRAEALRLLAAGQLDVVYQVPIAEAVAFTHEHPSVARFRYEQPAFLAAVYNARRPALAEPAHRRALTALLDRTGVAAAILGGARTTTGPGMPGDAGYDATVAPIPFSAELARRLLGDARPSAELLVPTESPSAARIADIWASDARGVATLRVVSLPYAQVLARLAAGDFDVAITSMSGGPDVDLWSRFASDAPPDQAWSGLHDAALDRLLAAARGACSDGERAAAARALHRRLDELQPMAFIAVDTRAGLASPRVGGLVGHRGPPPIRGLWMTARAGT